MGLKFYVRSRLLPCCLATALLPSCCLCLLPVECPPTWLAALLPRFTGRYGIVPTIALRPLAGLNRGLARLAPITPNKWGGAKKIQLIPQMGISYYRQEVRTLVVLSDLQLAD